MENHVGNDHRIGRSAVLRLARAVLEISQWTDYSKNLTVNIGSFYGGEAFNRVPDHAEALFEIRFVAPGDHQDTADTLAQLVAKNTEGCRLRIKQLSSIPPLSSSEDSCWLSSIWQAAGLDRGTPISVGGRRGISDANYFSAYMPTVDGLGPCGGNAHGILREGSQRSITEFLDLSSFAVKTELNVQALIRLAKYLNP